MTALGLKTTIPAVRAHLLPQNTDSCGAHPDALLHGLHGFQASQCEEPPSELEAEKQATREQSP